jgi:hypothetical protein
MVSTRLQLNGRTVVDAQVDGIDMSDYPDFAMPTLSQPAMKMAQHLLMMN